MSKRWFNLCSSVDIVTKMRKDKLYAFGSLALFVWISMTYFLFVHRPNAEAVRKRLAAGLVSDKDSNIQDSLDAFKIKIEDFETRLKRTSDENSQLLQTLIEAVKESRNNNQAKHISASKVDKSEESGQKLAEDHKNNENLVQKSSSSLVIAVLMFACNRVTVSKALDSLLAYRKDKAKFPIIVSQDCGHADTAQVIQSYGDQIQYIQQPDQSSIPNIPKKERKFAGYFKIARHYGWALNHTFNRYDQVIIVEDDLEVAPDFYEYFEATLPILKADKNLWCVSAWNDNGKSGLIDPNAPELLYRTDFFGGLGWMLTKELWNEIGPKWPRSYWDDWMRQPVQRKGRACIRPEISRTKTFGKIGVSNGLFFDKHLKFIQLNEKPVNFLAHNMTYLLKDQYDNNLDKVLNESPVVSLMDLKDRQISPDIDTVRVIYHTKEVFKKIARALGIMDDFKSGVPRMAYKGVVSTMYKGRRVFVAPNINWKGYDPSW